MLGATGAVAVSTAAMRCSQSAARQPVVPSEAPPQCLIIISYKAACGACMSCGVEGMPGILHC